MKKFTVLTQSYHQEDFLVILLKSFEKFKPKDFDIEYVVVEGSDDVSYKEKVCNISPNIKWFNNVESDTNNPINGASTANGLNIEFGKQFIESEWTFVCHNDIAVTSKNFFNIFQNLTQKYDLISMCKDNIRIGACHISGLFVKTNILKQVDCMPFLPELDVGDNLTVFCRDNELNYISLPNTHNDPGLWDNLSGKWSDIGKDAGVDRCVVDNEVIFTHLGRGTPKFLKSYFKEGKVTYEGWKLLHSEYLSEDNTQ
jgi:hypothetical protein